MAQLYDVAPGQRVQFSRTRVVLEMTRSEAQLFRAYLTRCPPGNSPECRRVLEALGRREEP